MKSDRLEIEVDSTQVVRTKDKPRLDSRNQNSEIAWECQKSQTKIRH